MPVYCYRCACGDVADEMRSVDDRLNPGPCQVCGSRTRAIVIQPVRGTFVHRPSLISDAQCEAKYGKDWRETPGSRRMARGEPERIYKFGTKAK